MPELYLKRVWIVKHYDSYLDMMCIDRIFNNEAAAREYMSEVAYRIYEIESWKVYSTWPEEWPSLVDMECYQEG